MPTVKKPDSIAKMNSSRLLEIANEACEYARSCIEESETGKNTSPLRRIALSCYQHDLREQADAIIINICDELAVERSCGSYLAIRAEVLERMTIERKIGNCEEYAILALNHIKRHHGNELKNTKLELIAVHHHVHIVLSIGDASDRLICDPSLNLVFKLNDEPEKLKYYSRRNDGNIYTPYDPQFHTINPAYEHDIPDLPQSIMLIIDKYLPKQGVDLSVNDSNEKSPTHRMAYHRM
jgi:hypothetical protein